eukprot:4939002-Prymnesium_polylepis.1
MPFVPCAQRGQGRCCAPPPKKCGDAREEVARDEGHFWMVGWHRSGEGVLSCYHAATRKCCSHCSLLPWCQ